MSSQFQWCLVLVILNFLNQCAFKTVMTIYINLFAQRSAKKGHTPGQERTKQKSTGSTSLERKVQHLDKEKQRR